MSELENGQIASTIREPADDTQHNSNRWKAAGRRLRCESTAFKTV